MITIDSNIPFTAKPRMNWPHSKMNVGDSFMVTDKTLSECCNANARYGRKLGWKFTARKIEVDGVRGVRVWRTA